MPPNHTWLGDITGPNEVLWIFCLRFGVGNHWFSGRNLYEFIGFGAMDATKPYEFIGFGALDVTKPYEFIGFRAGTVFSLQGNRRHGSLGCRYGRSSTDGGDLLVDSLLRLHGYNLPSLSDTF